MRQDQESIHEESSFKSSYRTSSNLSGSMQPESETNNQQPGSVRDQSKPKAEELKATLSPKVKESRNFKKMITQRGDDGPKRASLMMPVRPITEFGSTGGNSINV